MVQRAGTLRSHFLHALPTIRFYNGYGTLDWEKVLPRFEPCQKTAGTLLHRTSVNTWYFLGSLLSIAKVSWKLLQLPFSVAQEPEREPAWELLPSQ